MLVHSFMRGSRNFRQGGGGPGQSNNVFLVLSLFYRSQMVNFKETFHFSRFERGPTFTGGPTFPGGGGGVSNCLFPIETHITCDFPGGGSEPPVPLWIRICSFKACYLALLFTYSVSLGFL